LNKESQIFFITGRFVKEHSQLIIRENSKLFAQAIFTLFSIGIGIRIWFIFHEQTELVEVRHVLFTADWRFVFTGILLTFGYILLQGLMYVASFASIRHRILLLTVVVLFLKRNLISIFFRMSGFLHFPFLPVRLKRRVLQNHRYILPPLFTVL